MSNKDSKKTIFNKVASLRTDINKTISNKVNSTNKFINNNETIQFLIDLLKTLEDISQMAKTIIDMIHKNSEEVENSLKNIIIKTINELIYCYADAKTPSRLITDGVYFKVSDFDFNQMLHIDPMSNEGSLIYFDREYGLQSRDFNTFLYNVLKLPNVINYWGSQGGFAQIFSITFLPDYNGMKDVVHIKINSSYQNIKFTKFFQDLVESMDLIDTKTMLNNLVDSVYGTVSYNTSSAFDTLKMKTESEQIVNRMIEYGDDFDSAFSYVSKNGKKIEGVLQNKLSGTFSVNDTVSDERSFLSMETLKKLNENIDSLQNVSEVDKVLSDALYSLGSIDGGNLDSVNVPTINYKFIESILKNLGSIFVGVTLSPKIVLLMLIAVNHETGNSDFNIKTFMKNNSGMFNKIISGVGQIVIGFLVKKCEKSIKKLVDEKIVRVLKEKAENRKKQLNSFK